MSDHGSDGMQSPNENVAPDQSQNQPDRHALVDYDSDSDADIVVDAFSPERNISPEIIIEDDEVVIGGREGPGIADFEFHEPTSSNVVIEERSGATYYRESDGSDNIPSTSSNVPSWATPGREFADTTDMNTFEKASHKRRPPPSGDIEPTVKRPNTEYRSTAEIYRDIKRAEAAGISTRVDSPPLPRDPNAEDAVVDNMRHVLASITETDDPNYMDDEPREDDDDEDLPDYGDAEPIVFTTAPRYRNRSQCILEQRMRERTMTPRPPEPPKYLPAPNIFSRAGSVRPEIIESAENEPSVAASPLEMEISKECAKAAKHMIFKLLAINQTRKVIMKKAIRNVQLNIIEAVRRQKYMKTVENRIFRKEAASMVYQWVEKLTEYTPKSMSRHMYKKFISETFVPQKCKEIWRRDAHLRRPGKNGKVVSYQMRVRDLLRATVFENMTIDHQMAWRIMGTPKISKIMCTIKKPSDKLLLTAVDHIRHLLQSKFAYLLFIDEKRFIEPFVPKTFAYVNREWYKKANKSAITCAWATSTLALMEDYPELKDFCLELLSQQNRLRLWQMAEPEASWEKQFEADFDAYFGRPSRRADWVKAVVKNVFGAKYVQDAFNKMPIMVIQVYRPVFIEWLIRWALIAPETFVQFDPYTAFNANSLYAEEVLNSVDNTKANQNMKARQLWSFYSNKVDIENAKEIVEPMDVVYSFIMNNRIAFTVVQHIFHRLHGYPKKMRIAFERHIHMNSMAIPEKDYINIDELLPLATRIYSNVSYPAVQTRANVIIDKSEPRPLMLQEKYEKIVNNVTATVYESINKLPFQDRCYFVLTHPLLNNDCFKEIKDVVSVSNFVDPGMTDILALNAYILKYSASRTMREDFWKSCSAERSNIINNVRVPSTQFNDLSTSDLQLEADVRNLFAKHFVLIGRRRRSIPDEINIFIYAAIFMKHANCAGYQGFLNQLFLDCKLHEKELASDECYSDINLLKDELQKVLLRVQDDIIERMQRDDFQLPKITPPNLNQIGSSKNILAKYLIFSAAMLYDDKTRMEYVVNKVKSTPKNAWSPLFEAIVEHGYECLEQLVIDGASDKPLAAIYIEQVKANGHSSNFKLWEAYSTIVSQFKINNGILALNILVWYYNFCKIPRVAESIINLVDEIRHVPELLKCFGFTQYDSKMDGIVRDDYDLPDESVMLGDIEEGFGTPKSACEEKVEVDSDSSDDDEPQKLQDCCYSKSCPLPEFSRHDTPDSQQSEDLFMEGDDENVQDVDSPLFSDSEFPSSPELSPEPASTLENPPLFDQENLSYDNRQNMVNSAQQDQHDGIQFTQTSIQRRVITNRQNVQSHSRRYQSWNFERFENYVKLFTVVQNAMNAAAPSVVMPRGADGSFNESLKL